MSGFAGINREPLKKFKGAVRGVLMAILTECNYSDNPDFEFNFKSFPLKRGQWITSKTNISELTGLTIQQIKTALKKLSSFKIITNSSTNLLTNQATLITLINPDLFLHKKETATNSLTNDQQQNKSSEMQPTINQPQHLQATDPLTNYLTDLEKTHSLLNTGLDTGKEDNLTNPLNNNLTDDPPTIKPVANHKQEGNKERYKEGNNSPPKSPSKPQIPKSEFKSNDDFYYQCAKRIANAVCENKKINVSEEKIKKWTSQMKLLVQEDLQLRNTAFEDIEKALSAFEQFSNERFFPRIKNAKDFKSRFTDIEDFIKRNPLLFMQDQDCNHITNLLCKAVKTWSIGIPDIKDQNNPLLQEIKILFQDTSEEITNKVYKHLLENSNNSYFPCFSKWREALNYIKSQEKTLLEDQKIYEQRIPNPQLWQKINSRLQEEFDSEIYNRWLSKLDLFSASKQEIMLSAPSKFLRDWIKREYLEKGSKNGKGIKQILLEENPKLEKLSVIYSSNDNQIQQAL